MDCRSPGADTAASTHAVAALLLVVLAVVGAVIVGVAAFDVDERVLGTESPQVQFGYEYQNETGTLVVVHRSGDTIDGGRVVFENASGAIVGNWSNESEVTAGDAVAIRGVQPNGSVRILWRGEDETTPIGRWEGARTQRSPNRRTGRSPRRGLPVRRPS
jgi:hypothetical protein